MSTSDPMTEEADYPLYVVTAPSVTRSADASPDLSRNQASSRSVSSCVSRR